jgi:hypothetical protein
VFNELELEHYFEQLGLSTAARRYIRNTRTSPPFRAVQSNGRKNVCTAFASTKMGRTISTESRTGEYAIACEIEFDDEVVEYWDQPEPVTLVRTDSDGTQRTVTYFPDFLVLRKNGPVVFQVKLVSELPELKSKSPTDWLEHDDNIAFAPADAAFAAIGLPHQVVTTAHISQVRTPNVALLLRARHAPSQVDEALRRSVAKVLQDRSCILLAELLTALQRVDSVPILQMIADKEIFARLHDDPLSNPKAAWLALDPRLFAAIESPVEFHPPDTTSGGVALPSVASTRLALARIHRVQGALPIATRTRLRRLLRHGKEAGQTEFASLLPRYRHSGNRRPRLSAIQVEALNSSILKFYASPRRPSKNKAFRQYQVAATEIHPEYRPASRPTFLEFLSKFDPSKIGEGRGGRRSGNAAAAPSPVDMRAPAPTRPFEHASIDHCLLPLHVVLHEKNKRKITAQPWVTAVRCRHTGFLYSAWLSLRSPSCIVDAIVIRRCVRAHGRLPEQISSDRGSDFWSNYFTSTLAFLGVSHSMSPPASSRANSTIEEVFEHMQREWLQERPGNAVLAPAGRAVSKSHTARGGLPSCHGQTRPLRTWKGFAYHTETSSSRSSIFLQRC